MHHLLIKSLILLLNNPSLGHPQAEPQPQPSAVNSSSIPTQAANAFFQAIPSGETIGELIQIFEEEDIPDDNSTAVAATVYAASSSTSYLAARSFATPNAPVSPLDKINGQRTLNAFWNSTDHGGYNLTIPGCLSGYDVIGQIEAPNGTIIDNATFADLITMLQLPGAALWNYTMTFANKTYNDISATLDAIICDGPQGASRELLWPRPDWRSYDNREGFTLAYLIGGLGVISIGYAGTHLGVIHEGITANISTEVEVRILAATGFLEYLFLTTLWRLQSVERRYIGRLEALILNGFIWAGAGLLKLLEVVTQSCCSSGSARAGLNNLAARARNQVQVVTTGAGTTIGQSASTNFLLGLLGVNEQGTASSGDIESQVNAAGQAAAEVAQARVEGLAQAASAVVQLTHEAVQAQIAGGNPGESCG
ncbi:hypothetical protein JMJ35_010520 [Cladonia borealis]|uniref:Uncharacterized protein n=1 Tax=Cladonia borealis TaxID=184061 RepID=A0AA39QQ39_9LECA|nr:hypothetical protein JMJ35_010520 [Cladonia borealis]